MKMKKLAALWMAGVFVFSIVPMTNVSVAFAAKGGARVSAPKSAPSSPKTSTPSTNSSNTAKSASPNTKDYAPSKSAKDLNKEAPAASSKTNAAAAATRSSTGWGSALRNIGIFAGGMMLGGLLSHMFGFGAGSMMSDVFGLLMNVVLLVAAFVVIRMLWSWFRGRKNRSSDPYHQNFDVSQQQHRGNVTDIAAPQSRVQDIRPPQDGYDAKSMADRYRNR